MFNLVMKDLKISSKMSIFGLFFPIFISLAGLKTGASTLQVNIMYILAIFMITYFSVMYSNGYDQKNKVDIVINSFPINKKDVVRSKYLLLLIYVIMYSIAVIVMTNIFILVGIGKGGRAAGIWDFIVALNLLLIFYSIYYPIYFKSENGLAMFNQLIYMLIILTPAMLGKLGKTLQQTKIVNILIEMNIKKISGVLLIFSIIIFYISLQISKIIYLRKEF
ncbi:ABC-2 transporter permease [Clostridium sp. Cult2]|uniref:ABC-2 transporter permease n=1 Tax=Clostridium sp. Cult2 TaxID=2079003 RepID=UPI001F3E0AE4|nr:ABC-2 transporter permease [Clostridium sp. Cult2]